MDIIIQKTATAKAKPNENELRFGNVFTDHMLLMDYEAEKGWHHARIVPYSPLSLDPAASCLHYGQLIFEGMKAYRNSDDEVVLFRPMENFIRMNISAERMCIPNIDPEFMLSALSALLEVEKEWIPKAPGTSLYIRPFIISTEAFLGVRSANRYLFIIVLSPVGSYYANGLTPIKIYVEDNYVRSVKGGTGFAKCAGNYAAALLSQNNAAQIGYDQVLWLDGIERKNIEEVGSTNVFFVIEDEVVTPKLNGSILAGITRKSIIDLLKSWNMRVTERTISIDEVQQAYAQGKLTEAFGSGTAAVISPIGELKYGDMVMSINNGKIGELSQRIYDEITGIQYGNVPDIFDWIYKVCK